jgi:glyoxylase-like metal-dependent hydrolase (beta-lactamase superfamily II)
MTYSIFSLYYVYTYINSHTYAPQAWWKRDGTDYEWWSDPDIILEHGELLEVEGCKDLNVMVLHSPGHTPGRYIFLFHHYQ